MGRPHQRPRPNFSFPLVCKVASVGHLRRIMDGFPLPVHDDALAEVVPFGEISEEGRHWVAVNVNIDLPGLPVLTMFTGWIERADFVALVPIHTFLHGIPDTVHELFAPTLGVPLARRRNPSTRTEQIVRPRDGSALLRTWRSGGAPFLRTIAWLNHAVRFVAQEHQRDEMTRVRNQMTDGYPAEVVRRPVLAVLEWAVLLIGDGPRWPTLLDHLAGTLGMDIDFSEVLADDNEPPNAEEGADDSSDDPDV